MVISGFRLGGLAAAAIVSLSVIAGAARAATKGADLRVVDTAGKTLAEFRQYTGTVQIRTDPQADCFGPPGGSGDRVTVGGPTALGIVKDGLASDSMLRPLSVTDQFSFGLAVCGIGGHEAQGNAFWYLKYNHAGSQVGGDQLELHNGDHVLWYLAPTFPPPAELALRAPVSAKPGVPYRVTVLSYADDGTKTRAAGASVTGAALPTGAGGHTMVTSPAPGNDTLKATHASDIPSNRVTVCINDDLSRCPDAHGKRIFGSGRADRIHGSRGSDRIRARRGADIVDLRSGGRDRVSCGRGQDRVIVKHGDHDDRIAASCERVIRR